MLTNRQLVAEVQRAVDRLALTYPAGLLAVYQHAGQRVDALTRTTPEPKAEPRAEADPRRCTVTTRSGERCRRDAVHDGICGTHWKHGHRSAT